MLTIHKPIRNEILPTSKNSTPFDPEVGVRFIVASILIGITWGNKGVLSSLTKQTLHNEPLSQAQSE
jgi:hypothetical protein